MLCTICQKVGHSRRGCPENPNRGKNPDYVIPIPKAKDVIPAGPRKPAMGGLLLAGYDSPFANELFT